MTARYAIYFAPDAGSNLAEFGDRWLGRNPRTGRALTQPTVRSIPPERLAALTAGPRLYGFHATLKPPFRLADGQNEAALVDAVNVFVAKTFAWDGPGLVVAPVDGFLALVPRRDSPALNALATDCVRTFDAFRAPMTVAEIAKRMPDRLSERQRANLNTWGYPFVMEDFRFHMSLTGRVAHPLRAHAQVALAARWTEFAEATFRVDAISVFRQSKAGAPFREVHRAPLATLADD